MSKTRMINTDFWTDPWVVDTLNPLDAHLFIYLFTNAHTNVAGIYEISLRTISSEIGLEKEEIGRMLKRLEPKVHYIGGWVVLKNCIKNQNYHSPKIKTGIELVVAKCPPELMDYINWPDDFGEEKPKGSLQTQLIGRDINNFDDTNSRKGQIKSGQSVVETNNNRTYPQLLKPTTSSPVKYGMDTVSHSNSNSNSNSNTTVGRTVGTTGLKSRTGKSYEEINMLYEDLSSLVNDKYKAWYCSVFFKIGRERVMILASQARADGKDPPKLFSDLLKKESGITKGATP